MAELTASFAVLAEAERAATRLRAAGIGDDDVTIETGDPGPFPRSAEIGVPDDGASLEGLRGEDGEPSATTRMTIRLEQARVGRDEILAILHAAGGRTD